MFRIGNGYDVHRLTKGQSIKLAGIDIPSDYKIIAHSDGDIVVHSIMDAILGAIAENDIGHLFPDTDPKYKNADSLQMLQYVDILMKKKGYKIANIDVTIVLEKPKLKNFIPKMKLSLTNILNIEVDRINIKANTSEKLGFVGNSEGIEVYSVCLLESK